MSKNTTKTTKKATTTTRQADFYIIKADDLKPQSNRRATKQTADRIDYEYGQNGIYKALADAMKNGEKYTDFLNRLGVYDYATLCVTKALRNLYTMSNQQLFLDLEQCRHNDEIASNGTKYAEQIDKHTKKHAEHTKAVEQYTAIIQALKTTAEERATADSWKKHHQAQARKEQAQIDSLTALLSYAHSDREQLVQDAAEQILHNRKEPAEITAKVLESYGVDTAEELTAEQRADAQTRANYKAVMRAVKRSIRTLANPDAMNSTRTKVQAITPQQATAWINTYGKDDTDNGITAKQMTKSGYITVEHRNTAKYKGWYKVHHYKTVAPYQYIDRYTEDENGETDIAYLKTYNPFISNDADIDRIENLYKTANLTDRERHFLEMFARRCRVSADFKDCKAYAFKMIGITTATNQSTFFNRLKNKLNHK